MATMLEGGGKNLHSGAGGAGADGFKLVAYSLSPSGVLMAGHALLVPRTESLL